MRESIAYIIQEGEQLFLCVIDQEVDTFTRSPIGVKGCARLASECSWAVNGALGGYNPPLAPRASIAQSVVG